MPHLHWAHGKAASSAHTHTHTHTPLPPAFSTSCALPTPGLLHSFRRRRRHLWSLQSTMMRIQWSRRRRSGWTGWSARCAASSSRPCHTRHCRRRPQDFRGRRSVRPAPQLFGPLRLRMARIAATEGAALHWDAFMHLPSSSCARDAPLHLKSTEWGLSGQNFPSGAFVGLWRPSLG